MIEANLKQGGGRGVRGNMPADARFLFVGLYHHGHGIPADQVLDAPLDFTAARIRRLIAGGDLFDVWRIRREGNFDSMPHGFMLELGEEKARSARPASLQDAVQGV